jgi:hypothetical protein
MVRKGDLKQELLTVGTAAVTVTSAIPVNSIRGVYRLKLSELSGGANKLYLDKVLGATVTAVDAFPLSGNEVQDWPGHEVTEKSLPFWMFEEADCDHIQLTAKAASVSVFIQYADEIG